jgi:hypothetical protein
MNQDNNAYYAFIINGSLAKLEKVTRAQRITSESIFNLENPQAHTHTEQLIANDRPGHSHHGDTHAGNDGGIPKGADIKQQIKENFVGQACEKLCQYITLNADNDLNLIICLPQNLHQQVQNIIAAAHLKKPVQFCQKDYTKLTISDVDQYLTEQELIPEHKQH